MKTKIPNGYSVEDIFDSEVFQENPFLFYSTIKYIYTSNKYMGFQLESASPSVVHMWLQSLPLQHLFTQNIDGLESSIDCPITYLHGCLSSGTCQQCKCSMKENQLSDCYSEGKVAYCKCGVVHHKSTQ